MLMPSSAQLTTAHSTVVPSSALAALAVPSAGRACRALCSSCMHALYSHRASHERTSLWLSPPSLSPSNPRDLLGDGLGLAHGPLARGVRTVEAGRQGAATLHMLGFEKV